MMITKSQMILLLSCLITLGLTWQTYQSDQLPETVLPTRVIADGHSLMQDESVSISRLQLISRPKVELKGDLFSQSKRSKPTNLALRKTVNQSPKTANILPQLPFKYIGRWQDSASQAVILDYHGEILVVKQGDVVLNRYRVEMIKETPHFLQVEFLEMSLNKKQTMQARIGQE